MMKHALLFLSSVAVLFAQGGCVASYSHTDISQNGSSELDTCTVDEPCVGAKRVHVTQGDVVTAHIAPFNSDEKPMIGDVSSEDPSVILVLRSYGDKNYAFLGVKPGKTNIEFKADGVTVATIQAEVVSQHP